MTKLSKHLLIGGPYDGHIFSADSEKCLPENIPMGSGTTYHAQSVGRWSGPHYVYYSFEKSLKPGDCEIEKIITRLDNFYSGKGEQNGH